tara:strand:- start:30567 stop:32975 length:2409 start_codon:yes stop_codon:yes gene_type:complete
MRNKAIGLFLFLCAEALMADVTIDGSLGGVAGDSVSSGNNFTYDITQDIGQIEGNNLFHSFENFSIGINESANFSAQTPVTKIIARVTGGQTSEIYGSVSSSIEGASFWFINPAGLVIGDGASFNFSGSVNMSTASETIFSDGATFSSADMAAPSGLSFDPLAFGFIGSDSQPVLQFDSVNLSLNSGEDFNFVGQTISVTDSNLESVQGSISFYASGDQNIDVFINSLANEDDLTGAINFSDSTVDVSGPIGGNVFLKGGGVVFDESGIKSNSLESYNEGMSPGNITIDAMSLTIFNGSDIIAQARGENIVSDIALLADDEIRISGTGTLILSNPFLDNSTGGDITIAASSIIIEDDSFISGEAKQSAIGGNISIIGDSVVVTTNAGVSLDSKLNSSGGMLLIQTDTLEVSQGGDIVADAFATSSGANLRIEAIDMVVTDPFSSVTAQTTDNEGAGIDIILSGDLLVANEALIGTESFGLGDGSDINISARNVLLSSGGQIDASALNRGNGGNINIIAERDIMLTGISQQRATEISAKSGDIDREQNLSQNPGYGEGDGGSVNLFAKNISLNGNANVTATAERLSEQFSVVGNAGSIQLGASNSLVRSLNISNGAKIATSAPNSRGGNISIYVDKFIGITDSSITAFAGSEDATASGGDIFIDPELFYLNNATISANANGGNGGNIQIIADNIIQDQNSQITASSNRGINGDITLDGVINEVSSLETMKVPYSDISDMLYQRCNVAQLADRSSFVVSGGETVTNSPDAYQSSNLDASQNQLSSFDTSNFGLGRLAMLATCSL